MTRDATARRSRILTSISLKLCTRFPSCWAREHRGRFPATAGSGSCTRDGRDPVHAERLLAPRESADRLRSANATMGLSPSMYLAPRQIARMMSFARGSTIATLRNANRLPPRRNIDRQRAKTPLTRESRDLNRAALQTRWSLASAIVGTATASGPRPGPATAALRRATSGDLRRRTPSAPPSGWL